MSTNNYKRQEQWLLLVLIVFDMTLNIKHRKIIILEFYCRQTLRPTLSVIVYLSWSREWQ